MASDLERITQRVRSLAATVRRHRDTIPPLCAATARAAQQLAAGSARRSPSDTTLVTRLHRVTTQRDALIGDLDAVATTLDKLAAGLAGTAIAARTSAPVDGAPEQDRPARPTGALGTQTREQLLASKASFVKLIAEHRAKLAAYRANPDAHDNKGTLRRAPEHLRAKIIEGRVRALESQIRKQEGELRKTLDLLGE